MSAAETTNPLYKVKNPLVKSKTKLSRCPHEFDKRNKWIRKNFFDFTKFKTEARTGRVNPSCWDCFPVIDLDELIIKKKALSLQAEWLHPTVLCHDLNFPELSHVPWVATNYGEGNKPSPVIARGYPDPDTPASQRVSIINGWKIRPGESIDNIRCDSVHKIGICWYSWEESPDYRLYLRKYTEGAPVHPFERAKVSTSKFEHKPVEVEGKRLKSRGWLDICNKFSHLTRTFIRREVVELQFDSVGSASAENCIKYLQARGVRIDAKQDYENNMNELYFDDAYQSMDSKSYAGDLASIQVPNYYSNSYENNEMLLIMSLVVIICLCACAVVYLFGVLTGYIGSKILSKNHAKSQHIYEYGNVNGDMSVNEDNEL